MKYRNALAINAGLKIFIPTPPKISLPITIPNDVATATCHNGMDGGKVRGMSAHVTKKPSEIGCFLTTPNNNSQKAPDAKVTAIIGMIVTIPVKRFSDQVVVRPKVSDF